MDETTSARPSPPKDQAKGEPHPNPIGLPLVPAPHPPSGRLDHSPVCLSPEISLDVDADRDGVIEKNNPKKVPSSQGRLPGGLPGQSPRLGPEIGQGPPSKHRQLSVEEEEPEAQDRFSDPQHP